MEEAGCVACLPIWALAADAGPPAPVDEVEGADGPELVEESFGDGDVAATVEFASFLAAVLAERDLQFGTKLRAFWEARAAAGGGAIEAAPLRCAATWRRIALAWTERPRIVYNTSF